MKAIIMAGGFAKRLGLSNKSKCFIELGGKFIIDYTLDKLKDILEIDEIIIITNDIFFNDFMKWAEKHVLRFKIRIVSDGSVNEQSKTGALTALLNFLQKENFNEDFFLAGADNFFRFSLREIFEIFKKENKDLAVFYDIKDREIAKKFGVASIINDLVENFEEKPENPESTIVSSAMYFFKKETILLILELKN